MSTIVLTDADTGASIAARAGDEIVIQLPENPTTGYRWEVETTDGILEPVADGYIAADPIGPGPGGQPVFGRGSLRELRFRASKPGVARLALKHWQAWEGEGSVVGRFVADIVVARETGGG